MAFHGHECGGLTIGYRAVLYAAKLLDLHVSDDEQVVCIMTGKQTFSIYHCKSGRPVRSMLREKPEDMARKEFLAYYRSCTEEEMFTIMDARIALPEQARILESYRCERCGETAGANWMRESSSARTTVDPTTASGSEALAIGAPVLSENIPPHPACGRKCPMIE